MTESYQDAVNWLYGRVNFERLGAGQYTRSDFKLERMARLLDALGNPQNQIPVVHIAGTKGKGTTASLISEILIQAGYRTGLYTSPHRIRIEERFVVNRELISEENFVRLVNVLVDYVEALSGPEQALTPTFFELVTAMAWLHFLEQQVDIAVLEVGLGGRLDSTNLCQPLVTAITSISLDHTRLLGETVELITREKAGIIKPNIPVVTSVKDPACLDVIRERAQEYGCNLIRLGNDFDFELRRSWKPENRKQQLQITLPAHANDHTLDVEFSKPGLVYGENIALAAAAATELSRQGWNITSAQIAKASEEVSLPLRFEIIHEQPLVIVDAAHNPASIRQLINTVNSSFPAKRVYWLLSISRDKDIEGIVREFQGVETILVSQYLGNVRASSAEELSCLFEAQGIQTLAVTNSPEESLAAVQRWAGPDDVIVGTGSLFYASELRERILAKGMSSNHSASGRIDELASHSTSGQI